MFQNYLSSQLKLSSMTHKPKLKISGTINDLETIKKSKIKVEKLTETLNKVSGSEYFPSTDSGKNKINIR